MRTRSAERLRRPKSILWEAIEADFGDAEAF